VNGSADNKVLVGDIVDVVKAYFKDYAIQAGEPPGTSDYVPMYDLNAPYNPATATGGNQRVDDIVAVVNAYFDTCPLVDTQVAQAVRWAIDTDGNPSNGNQPVPQFENESALLTLGYVALSTIDVPGQGVHYAKLDAWDGVFDPAEPEGLVYNDGRLAAHLYVVNGADVGWVPEDPGPNQGPCGDGIDNGGDGFTDGADSDCVLGAPSGPPPDDVDIDSFTYCGAGATCSWATSEGWHLHHNLCIIHIGKPNAQLTVTPDDPTCAFANSQSCHPSGCGTYLFNSRIGWMGHLYSWYPNANRVPDVNGTMNGRFADCFPDTEGWKPYNCPQ
jgi:hypothetical protein